MYRTEQIVDAGFNLSYRFYPGNKTNTLFLFHGFGQTNTVFDSFAASLLIDYSVISIDLFFHGKSIVTDNNPAVISIDRWNILFDRILVKHNIDRFSMLSYSMGSRFVVSLLESYASRIDNIVFIAPDGFGNNFWFRIATSTMFARYLFKSTMDNPAWIRAVVSVFGSVGIFNSITKRFIERNLEAADHRKKIYESWVGFRKLTIASDAFVKLIYAYKIDFMCFCGKSDQLVAKDAMQVICVQTGGLYVELDLAHHKMLQALEMNELKTFLIPDR